MVAERPVSQLVVDCDPGIDDALALGVVAHAVRSGLAVLHAVVAVGGNVGLSQTAANVGFLTQRLGLDVPTFRGAAEPLAGAIPGDAAVVHGRDGLGVLRVPGPWTMPSAATPAQLVELIGGLDPSRGPRVLLATGPLTNLAAMVEVAPDLADHVDRVVVMGGAFGDPGGNVTECAEFNVWIDPEAWSMAAAAGLPLEIVPLDVTTKVVLTRDDLPTLTAGGSPTLVSSIVSAGIDLYDELLGTPFCEMHDPLAAAVVFDPGLMKWSEGSISVRLGGDERGRTVIEPSSTLPPARLALAVDVPRARSVLLEALAAVADR